MNNQIKEIVVVEGRDDTNAIKRAVDAVTIETHGFGISEETWNKLDWAYKEKGIIIFTDPDHAGNEIRRRIKEKYPEAKEAFLSRKKASLFAKESNRENENQKTDHEIEDRKKERKAQRAIDIGIENAGPDDIREALSKAHATYYDDDCENGIKLDIEDAGKDNKKCRGYTGEDNKTIKDDTDKNSNENSGKWIPYILKDLEDGMLIGFPDSKDRREALGDILGIGYSNGKSLLKKLNGMRIPKEDFKKAIKKIDENNK